MKKSMRSIRSLQLATGKKKNQFSARAFAGLYERSPCSHPVVTDPNFNSTSCKSTSVPS